MEEACFNDQCHLFSTSSRELMTEDCFLKVNHVKATMVKFKGIFAQFTENVGKADLNKCY